MITVGNGRTRHRDRHKIFIKNLLAASPKLDAFHVQYPYPLLGYKSPLSTVCSSGYYKQLTICTRCLSKNWIAGQLLIIVAILSIVITVFLWTNRRNMKKKLEDSLINKFFSKVKIVIGFYQVTYGLLEVFSYITWPGCLESIAKYSGFPQFNLVQIVPVQCLACFRDCSWMPLEASSQ